MSMHEHGVYFAECDCVVIINDEVHFFEDESVAMEFLKKLESDQADAIDVYSRVLELYPSEEVS
ncbi:hypothetical protein MWH25_01255 [Natroniella acetigena]|uniref:hypothetical protein n=1 Tax=Natroniella acetigena TaxID=52004 RepID=UPI00200B19F1|nr:hypothetical protein [Natroniella acetigena]MCK8826374.1 hypothetical protein [Natroniella acetigena]